MLLRLFLVFTIIPFLELYILIEIGQYLGALSTIALVVLTGFLGACLARHQGLSTLNRVRGAFDRGEIPTHDLLDGLLILVAGVVLITPGLLTDGVGMLLLIPQTRNRFKYWLQQKLTEWIQKNRVDIRFYR